MIMRAILAVIEGAGFIIAGISITLLVIGIDPEAIPRALAVAVAALLVALLADIAGQLRARGDA